MIKSELDWLEPELMDIARLFRGAEELSLFHTGSYDGKSFLNTITVDGKEFHFSRAAQAEGQLQYKSLFKRYAKLALYTVLKERFGVSLPWGALTGIRPTRLAYQEIEAGRDFISLLFEMDVSKENIALVKEVVGVQKGIYEKNSENCDLYVSLPFCPTRCSYCSFITAPIDATRKYMKDYLLALERELDASRPLIHRLRSVYVGGGTPFVLEPKELEEVLSMIEPLRTNGCEYTVEAGRPDVFTKEKLDLCKKYGVTRICINAQSFSDKTLERIGRRHTGGDVELAFAMAKPYGFTVNCDLIAGLTGESVEEFEESVKKAISLAPENITVHTLCLKKGARLKEETLRLEDDGLSEMIALSRKYLAEAGYEPYYLYRQKYMAGAHENVGWTKKGFASVYNIDVMEEIADNLAVGANAVSKKVILKENRIERYGSPKDIPTYLNKVETIIEEKSKLFR